MTKSRINFFEVERAGINTTFQDTGRKNLNHIGIPISGAMDKRNFLLANKLVMRPRFTTIFSPVLGFSHSLSNQIHL